MPAESISGRQILPTGNHHENVTMKPAIKCTVCLFSANRRTVGADGRCAFCLSQVVVVDVPVMKTADRYVPLAKRATDRQEADDRTLDERAARLDSIQPKRFLPCRRCGVAIRVPEAAWETGNVVECERADCASSSRIRRAG